MKAFLLAAGLGTRLRPLTEKIPKCLVPICGKPLMQWWLELFERHGVSEVLVNTHYLAEQVRSFTDEWNAGGGRPSVYEFHEEKLLGSGGTVAANRAFVEAERDFFICYADNLTNIDLSALREFHEEREKKGGILTMALFQTNLPKQCGIVETDEEGLIREFVEKPEHPKSNSANAGIYVAGKELFEYLPSCGAGGVRLKEKDSERIGREGSGFIGREDSGSIGRKGSGFVGREGLGRIGREASGAAGREEYRVTDFGKDVLPKLVGKMYGFRTEGFLLDIGTPENYEKANREWQG